MVPVSQNTGTPSMCIKVGYIWCCSPQYPPPPHSDTLTHSGPMTDTVACFWMMHEPCTVAACSVFVQKQDVMLTKVMYVNVVLKDTEPL